MKGYIIFISMVLLRENKGFMKNMYVSKMGEI